MKKRSRKRIKKNKDEEKPLLGLECFSKNGRVLQAEPLMVEKRKGGRDKCKESWTVDGRGIEGEGMEEEGRVVRSITKYLTIP